MLRLLVSPRLIGVHVLALAAVSAAAWLGIWQYDAWQMRREAQMAELSLAAPEALPSVMGPDDPFPGEQIGQPVQFRGEWLAGETFFVSDRERAGERGYWVVTPVAVCDDNCAQAPAMPVVRGWAPRPVDVSTPTGAVHVRGWLQPPEGSGQTDPTAGDDVLPQLRVADVVQRLDRDLYGAYVIARQGQTASAARDPFADLAPVTPAQLPEPSTFTAARNLLYAVEWWVFGAFAAFLWWRWCRDEVSRASAGGAGVAPEGSTGEEAGATDGGVSAGSQPGGR